jgi:hypothetical protein
VMLQWAVKINRHRNPKYPSFLDSTVLGYEYSRSHQLGQNPQGFRTSLWGHWTSEFTTFSIFNHCHCNKNYEELVYYKCFCKKHSLR